jgi:hypothetical protein
VRQRRQFSVVDFETAWCVCTAAADGCRRPSAGRGARCAVWLHASCSSTTRRRTTGWSGSGYWRALRRWASGPTPCVAAGSCNNPNPNPALGWAAAGGHQGSGQLCGRPLKGVSFYTCEVTRKIDDTRADAAARARPRHGVAARVWWDHKLAAGARPPAPQALLYNSMSLDGSRSGRPRDAVTILILILKDFRGNPAPAGGPYTGRKTPRNAM